MLYITPLETIASGPAPANRDDIGLQKTALRELDHLFAFTLLKEMRKTIPRDTLFNGGYAREMYEEMLYDALSAEIAKTGRLGVAEHVERQLRAAGKLGAQPTGQTVK